MINLKYIILSILIVSSCNYLYSQQVPSEEMNVPFLVTFGNEADKSWGDDDFCQIMFFVIPENFTSPVYIRIFDPEIGGNHDEIKGSEDTKMKFSVYGGSGCITNKDAKGVNPLGNYTSGNLLVEKTFKNSNDFDDKWFTFRPISPAEGELDKKYGGYIIKIIAQGVSGDDGNLYKYFLSTKLENNIAVEGGNSFAFEYSFRLNDYPNEVSHLYPYIDDQVVSIKQSNFDWDNDGRLMFVSVMRKAVGFSLFLCI